MVRTIEAERSQSAAAAAAGFRAYSFKRWKQRIGCGDEPVEKHRLIMIHKPAVATAEYSEYW